MSLHNRIVLVKPPKSGELNATGMRGTLRVVEAPERPRGVKVEVVLGYPEMSDMGGMPAHEEVIVLAEDELPALLASEEAGTFSYEVKSADGDERTV